VAHTLILMYPLFWSEGRDAELRRLDCGVRRAARGRNATDRVAYINDNVCATRDEQKQSWEGAVIATSAGTLHMREALCYILSHPVSTVIIGCDSLAQVEENVRLAREFTPLSEKQMIALEDEAEPVSGQALFFRIFQRA
jgi:aryl-alcohol dehydrogenase-like predicted oxidoreductase